MGNVWIIRCGVLIGIALFASPSFGQAAPATWQQEVRRYSEQQDWQSAMRIVEAEIARSPQDMDVRSWRARVLTWSGKLDQAEREYLRILAVAPNDPDNWMGLAAVYSRQNRSQDAVHALNRAITLDFNRADLHLARARALRALNENPEAKAEFEQALALDPRDDQARTALASFKPQTRHELLLGTNTDLFSFMDTGQQESIGLISHWTSHWETFFGGSFYRLAGIDAQKLTASVTSKSKSLGSLTLGAAIAHDGGVVPKHEAMFAYDRGWRLSHAGLLRGLETNYEQHWYWYSSARIITLNETTIAYFPRDWMWSLRLTGACSQFPGTPAEWRPAGLTKLSFPLKSFETRQLGGNIFFATGTENYSQVDQVGHFSSHTFGGGLNVNLTAAQHVNGFAGYETRTAGVTQTTFGLTYGIRF
jgi:tetratricopeptide (TPR) repeat protein